MQSAKQSGDSGGSIDIRDRHTLSLYIKRANRLNEQYFGLLSRLYPLSFIFFFFQVLNSCHNANLVCSIGIVVTVLWFRQPLHYCCFLFLFFFFPLLSFLFFFFFSTFFFRVISSCPLFYFIVFYFIYIKLLVNTINCHHIFTIVDMLIPYRLK